ncbi:metallophosphoesterase [Nannocystaceae bacterium ST9]
MIPRVRVLPDRGTLLVSTDLHGKRDSFERLRERFFDLRGRHGPSETHWALLGDLVHGPSPEARARSPLYDYEDESPALIDAVFELRERFPEHVHFVLGNHDHGHVGGPHTRKFHADEVLALEARLTPEQRRRAEQLFGQALLAIATPSGLLLTHGSPGEALHSLADLDALALVDEPDPRKRELLRSILGDYGQRGEVTARVLASVSRPGLALHLVVHGHDRDESGLFVEGGNQICPVIFGARRELERCLVLDLATRHRCAAELREGVEIVRVHESPAGW